MSLDWRSYVHNRRIAEHPDGFYVIVPDDETLTVPIACPVCDFVLRSRDDENEFLDLGCCSACAMTWAHARKDAWRSGWRPNKEEVKIAIESRPMMIVDFEVD